MAAPLDFRRLRPVDLCRLLNSTRLGTVLSERQLRRQRALAGYRIGSDGEHLDLFKYAAWLQSELELTGDAAGAGYAKHKEQAAERSSKLSRAGRDIGPIPDVVDPERRRRAEASLVFFAETYFPEIFYLRFSQDHFKVIARLEEVILRGGCFALAMPRGSGKTSLCEIACLWGILIGAQEFIVLIGAEKSHAIEMMESIKTELLVNDLLLADFPEAIYPFRAMEGIANRCKGQLHEGKPTHIRWSERQLVFPTIPVSRASGAILRTTSLLGRIRGIKFKRPDGAAVRPTLALVDDPQTEASASSQPQITKRRNVILGAVMHGGAPGHEKNRIGLIVPCTVIQPGDLADELLDRRKHPEFNGERMQLVYEFPTDSKLWDDYAEILRAPGGLYAENLARATAFYQEHREAMDAGARVAWPERYQPGEVSALQHAMNLKIADEPSFFAEYQNQPLREEGTGDHCTADQIVAKLSHLARREIPAECSILTMAIDVHDSLLYWLVAAWTEAFQGYVIDYGTWPEQGRRYFTMRAVTATLRRKYPGHGKEAAIHAGLVELVQAKLGSEWAREDGTVLRIGRALVDEGYLPETVHSAIRSSGHGGVLMPAKGFSIRAANKPIRQWKRKPGDRLGHEWRITRSDASAKLRVVQIDTNAWKSIVHSGFATPAGDKGSWQLWGSDPERHRLYAQHVANGEFSVTTEGRGRRVHEWQPYPNRPDNHWFDCTVGAAVAASIEGAKIPGTAARRRRRRRIRYSS